MKKSFKSQVEEYKKEFAKKHENSANKGIKLGKLRPELEADLERRLSESPSFMKEKLGEVVTTPSGHKYNRIFKSKKK